MAMNSTESNIYVVKEEKSKEHNFSSTGTFSLNSHGSEGNSTTRIMSCWGRSRFAVVTLVLQALFLVLFGIFSKYSYHDLDEMQNRWFYPMFQNVHVMMFVGFGFLMTFLKRYGYSAVGVNMLIAALVLQWHIIFQGLLHLENGKFSVGLEKLILADFAAAAILISFGAVIGKTSPLQLLIMAFIEVIVCSVNEMLAGGNYLKATDIGGSMVVHVFGAYFGLAVSRVIYKPKHSESPNEGANYTSDTFSMIGTIFLWLYWPSFNSAIATTVEQQTRAVVNTYISLSACVLVTFAVSSLIDKRARFNMVHVQNATLAGGVAVGTAANFMLMPWGAALVGCIAAVVSVIGFAYIQPLLLRAISLHDSCGVNNLHGMPGILAAIIGAIGAACANVDVYGDELPLVFRELDTNGTVIIRTPGAQAGYQMAVLGVTLALALVGGALTGLLLRFVPGLDEPEEEHLFSDEKFFEVPDDFLSTFKTVRGHERPLNPENGNRNSSDSHSDSKL